MATSSVDDEVAHLRGLDLPALRARWRSLVGRSAPAHLPRHLLLHILAYRIQAEAFGDLDRDSLRFLAQVAKAGDCTPVPAAAEKVRTGTVFVREWDGVRHHVTAQDGRFAWNGATYRSLSEVARAITGTKWNGPRFFGLRDRAPGSQGGRAAP